MRVIRVPKVDVIRLKCFCKTYFLRSGETTMRSDNPRPSLSALGHPHLPLENGGTADNYSERAIDVPPAFASAAGGARPKTTAGEIYANA